jgi:hypothetical protein
LGRPPEAEYDLVPEQECFIPCLWVMSQSDPLAALYGDYQSARHGRLELLLFRRGFHPRQRMLEWRSRNPEIAA